MSTSLASWPNPQAPVLFKLGSVNRFGIFKSRIPTDGIGMPDARLVLNFESQIPERTSHLRLPLRLPRPFCLQKDGSLLHKGWQCDRNTPLHHRFGNSTGSAGKVCQRMKSIIRSRKKKKNSSKYWVFPRDLEPQDTFRTGGEF